MACSSASPSSNPNSQPQTATASRATMLHVNNISSSSRSPTEMRHACVKASCMHARASHALKLTRDCAAAAAETSDAAADDDNVHDDVDDAAAAAASAADDDDDDDGDGDDAACICMHARS